MIRGDREILTQLFVFSCLILECIPFAPSTGFTHARNSYQTTLNLVPISKFANDLTFLSEPNGYRCCIDQDGMFKAPNGDVYELCLAEEQDLADIARFVVQSFGADAIRLSRDMNSFERLLMQPAAELINGYSGIIAFAEVLAGMRSRLSNRLESDMDVSPPKLQGLSREEKIDVASKTSLVLVVGKRHEGNDWHIDVIASVELRLEICDAKIPFSLPWLDRIERRLASLIGLGKNAAPDLQPYLSNLCVEDKYRGKKIGRDLVRCIENMAEKSWKYSRMYLHVDTDNKPALSLYKSEGYRDVGLRWRPFWAGQAADIGYYVKKLGDNGSEKDQARNSKKVDKARTSKKK